MRASIAGTTSPAASQSAVWKDVRPEAARLASARALAGAVAHDLNNVLTSVLGFGTLLAEQVTADADASANAREVLLAGERAATLTRQLLAFSGRQVLTPERIGIGRGIDENRERLEQALGASIEFQLSMRAGVPDARVDAVRLIDALVELASNARDAMPNGGRLSVTVDSLMVDGAWMRERHQADAGQYVRVTVTDTGTGISAAAQARLFEPFFTTKPRGTGTGLGLSTVYGFVTQSGGFVRVRTAPGAGTAVALHLPVFEDGRTRRAHDVPRPRSAGTGETVLVVDDAEDTRALVAEALRRSGYRVIVAGSASEALYMAGNCRGSIHLLLTDVVMPGSGGLDLARELRADRPALKVIYMSGFPEPALATTGASAALRERFLQKPFSVETLLQDVAALLTPHC